MIHRQSRSDKLFFMFPKGYFLNRQKKMKLFSDKTIPDEYFVSYFCVNRLGISHVTDVIMAVSIDAADMRTHVQPMKMAIGYFYHHCV